MCVRATLAVAGLLWLATPVTSEAQADELTRAERLLENAEFEAAADALETVAESDVGLDRAQVSELLRLRAVVRSALGRDRDADRDLAALASVLDGREPGPLPDALRRRFDRHRRRARSIDARVLISPGEDTQVEVRLVVDNDPSGLVRRQELVCRADGREVASTDADRLTVSGESELECQAALFGPGAWRAAEASTTWRGTTSGGGGEEELDWFGENWPYLVAGVGGAVALIVLISVIAYLAGPTGVSGPMWVPGSGD